jgi:hypothetical protein
MRYALRILTALATVTCSAGVISSAQAATYPLGTFSPGVGQIVENVGTGPFTDFYTFDVTENSAVGGQLDNLPLSLTFNSVTQSVLNIADLTLTLEGPSGPLTSALSGSSLRYANLIAGQPYTLEATGIGTGSAGGTYALAYNVSAVPIPAALLLFSSGLVGLGAFAKGRLRRQAAV